MPDLVVEVDLDDLEAEDADGDRAYRDTSRAEAGMRRPEPPSATAPAAEVAETAEPSEKDKASGDFVWDEEESEALRQARKDAELTASADSVRAYLKQIGKVALLNAEEEVELAKRIEAGLFAAEKMREFAEKRREAPGATRRDCNWICATATARKTICWRRTCDWWSRWPSATPAAAWRSWTSSRKATSA